MVKYFQNILNHEFYVSVNLTSRQLRNLDLLKNIPKILKKTEIKPSSLQIEITENSTIYYPGNLEIIIFELSKMGVKFAIDDFGTGFSSFSYLKDFPVRQLKIDKSFIQNVNRDEKKSLITKAIIALGHNLNMEIVAEGVENKEELDFLEANNCDSFVKLSTKIIN